MIDNSSSNKVSAVDDFDQTATDAASIDSAAVDTIAQLEAARPKDHELLKEILGEDYSTQAPTTDDVYEQEDATDFNSRELLNAADGETDIDKSIGIILHEDDELADDLEVESTNTESTDIDEFLQKYLTDDDADDAILLQQQPDEETSEDSDENGENNIDELIQKILNEDTGSETLVDENRPLNAGLEKKEQSARASIIADRKITNQSSENRPAAVKNITRKPESYRNKSGITKQSKPATTGYRVPAISFLLLMVTAGLVWYVVTIPHKEPARYTEIKSDKLSEIKKSSESRKEISSHQAETDIVRERSDLSSSRHIEPPAEPEKAAPTVTHTASINNTLISLIEQDYSPENLSPSEDIVSIEAEIETHETGIESTVQGAAVEARNEVSDEIVNPAASMAKSEDTAHEAIPADSIQEIPADSIQEIPAESIQAIPADSIQEIPAATKNGEVYWALNLSAVHRQILPASRELEGIRSAGIPAELHLVYVNRKKWYRIRVTGFSSYTEAKDFMVEVRDKTDIESYWISKEIADSE